VKRKRFWPAAPATLKLPLSVTYHSEVYRGAAHGYTMADTPAYDEAAAERHYAELFALLDRSLAR
jgi:dienelactone hydrolase